MRDRATSAGIWRLQAPAKLNLSLAVTGRRPDGFHKLAGVMVLLDLADDLRLAPEPGQLRLTGQAAAGAPQTSADNLAARGLIAALGEDAGGYSLSLEKHIPARAGLGGGSSDAAAAWRLGRRAAGCDETPSPDDVRALAAIGADIPFFAAQVAAAWVTGIGERVEPLTLPPDMPREVVLVHPPFGLSTAAVFAELRERDWSASLPPRIDMEAVLAAGNDLLAPARRLRPEIDALLRLVVSAGAEARMTGSGPTLFALADDPERSDAIAGRLGRARLTTTRTRLRAEPASIGLEEVSA